MNRIEKIKLIFIDTLSLSTVFDMYLNDCHQHQLFNLLLYHDSQRRKIEILGDFHRENADREQ